MSVDVTVTVTMVKVTTMEALWKKILQRHKDLGCYNKVVIGCRPFLNDDGATFSLKFTVSRYDRYGEYDVFYGGATPYSPRHDLSDGGILSTEEEAMRDGMTVVHFLFSKFATSEEFTSRGPDSWWSPLHALRFREEPNGRERLVMFRVQMNYVGDVTVDYGDERAMRKLAGFREDVVREVPLADDVRFCLFRVHFKRDEYARIAVGLHATTESTWAAAEALKGKMKAALAARRAADMAKRLVAIPLGVDALLLNIAQFVGINQEDIPRTALAIQAARAEERAIAEARAREGGVAE